MSHLTLLTSLCPCDSVRLLSSPLLSPLRRSEGPSGEGKVFGGSDRVRPIFSALKLRSTDTERCYGGVRFCFGVPPYWAAVSESHYNSVRRPSSPFWSPLRPSESSSEEGRVFGSPDRVRPTLRGQKPSPTDTERAFWRFSLWSPVPPFTRGVPESP